MSLTLSTATSQTVGLLMLSNVFMTFAWYGHLRHLAARPWVIEGLQARGNLPR